MAAINNVKICYSLNKEKRYLIKMNNIAIDLQKVAILYNYDSINSRNQ
jgi:hypothetical protein